jgi:hypothetical protein
MQFDVRLRDGTIQTVEADSYDRKSGTLTFINGMVSTSFAPPDWAGVTKHIELPPQPPLPPMPAALHALRAEFQDKLDAHTRRLEALEKAPADIQARQAVAQTELQRAMAEKEGKGE